MPFGLLTGLGAAPWWGTIDIASALVSDSAPSSGQGLAALAIGMIAIGLP